MAKFTLVFDDDDDADPSRASTDRLWKGQSLNQSVNLDAVDFQFPWAHYPTGGRININLQVIRAQTGLEKSNNSKTLASQPQCCGLSIPRTHRPVEWLTWKNGSVEHLHRHLISQIIRSQTYFEKTGHPKTLVRKNTMLTTKTTTKTI